MYMICLFIFIILKFISHNKWRPSFYFNIFGDLRTKKKQKLNQEKEKENIEHRHVLISNYMNLCYHRYCFVVVIIVVVIVFAALEKKGLITREFQDIIWKKLGRIRCVAKEEKKTYEQKKNESIYCVCTCMCVYNKEITP